MLDDVIAHHLATLFGCGLNDALNILYCYRQPSTETHTDQDGLALAQAVYDEHMADTPDHQRTNEDLTFAYATTPAALMLRTIK